MIIMLKGIIGRILVAGILVAGGLVTSQGMANADESSGQPNVLGTTIAILGHKPNTQTLRPGGDTFGWQRGSIKIHVKVYSNGSLFNDFSKTCKGATKCSVRGFGFSARPGTKWRVVAIGSGPGGSTRDSKTIQM